MKGLILKATVFTMALELLLLPVVSCSKAEPAAVQEPVLEETALVQVNENIKEVEVMTPVAQPESREGLITFFSGDVSIFDDGSWYEAEIGDFVAENNSIKVEADSYCEVQFGNTAVIKIQENSELNLATVDLSPGAANVNVDMKLGNVLCKVQKLASEESFRVKTQTAVCGVRGTEFSVVTDAKNETVLAVKEGAVSVLPKSVDVDALKDKVSGKGDEIIEIIEQLEKEAPVVRANEEIAIDEKLVEDTKKSAEKVETIVEEISKEEATVVREESIKKLETAIGEQQKEMTTKVEPPKQLSAENIENLKQINDMKLIAIAPAPQAVEAGEEKAQEPAVPVIKLYKVGIESLTDDTLIEANGRLVGKNKFSGIYEEGEKIAFNVTRTGYETYTFDFTVTEATARLYKVELKKLPEPEAPPKKVSIAAIPSDSDIFVNGEPAGKGIFESEYKIGTELSVTISKTGYASRSETILIDENTPERIEFDLQQTVKTITFTANPPDSDISVNGVPAGKGRVSQEFSIGDMVSVTATRNGYSPESLKIDITAGLPDTYSITLEKKPVDSLISPFKSRVIGKVSYSAGRIFAADSSGNLFSSTIAGTGAWTRSSANSPNANSAPVAAGDLVIFTGAKEMLVFESASGNLYNKTQLDSNSAHMFGRNVVPLGDRFIYPRNNSLMLSTFRKGAPEDIINLPVESGMTPAVWKGKIVLADIEGTVNIIDPVTKSAEGKISTSAVQPIALSMTIFGDTGFFANRKGNIAAVDLKNKKLLWESQISDDKVNVFTNPCNGGGNVFVYTGTKIFAFDMLKGTQPFQPIESTCTPNCSAGKLYYGTRDGSLVEANAETGKTIRTIKLDNGAVTTQPVFAENRIIVGTATGKIMVLNPAGF